MEGEREGRKRGKEGREREREKEKRESCVPERK